MNEKQKDEYIKKLESHVVELEGKLEKHQMSIEAPETASIVWKIRHKETGLFSGGGTPMIRNGVSDTGIKWTKTGKIWRQRGALVNHLRQHTYSNIPAYNRQGHLDDELLPYTKHWEIVAFATFESKVIDSNIFWSDYLIKTKS